VVAQWEFQDQMVFFGNCDPKNKKNYRTRCSALIQTQSENILIDTSPDLRQQLINNKVKKIDKVFYSHMHADQTHGINDLRVFYIQNKKTIPYMQIIQQKNIYSILLNIALLIIAKNIQLPLS
jgi:phosphoribosyl 1,2-cyclic phosphodiesterase